MITLIVSDIHANYRALKAVLDTFGSADEIWCLGDIVSYGPAPQPCIDLVRQSCRHVIRGNHDNQVEAGPMVNPPSLEYLLSLPLTLTSAQNGTSYRLVHGAPSNPLLAYLRPTTDKEVLCKEVGLCDERCILCGHSHMAMLMDICDKRIVNVGTIGQPRDGDSRAQCVLIEDGEFRFERVAYDLDALAYDYKNALLPEDQKEKWLRNTIRGFWDEHGLQLGPFSPRPAAEK